MKQYQFEIIHKQTSIANMVRATAQTPEIARAQIVLMYGQTHKVMDLFCDINPAHKILGEIDCSDFPEKDIPWLMAQANIVESSL